MDIFDTSRYSLATIKQILIFYALYVRETGHGLTYTFRTHLPMPILATTISSKISAIIYLIGIHDSSLGECLHAWRQHRGSITDQISAMNRDDLILRGPKDAWCRIPVGLEFVEHLVAMVFKSPRLFSPAMRTMYVVIVLFEWFLGCRTREVFAPSKQIPAYEFCPATTAADNDINLELNYLEASASIHAAQNCHVQFFWAAENCFYCAHQVRQWPDGVPDEVILYATQKNNPQGTTSPSNIIKNPQLPGYSSICLVTALSTWLRTRPNQGAHDYLFLGAHDKVFRSLVKDTAKEDHFDETRTHIASIRMGCASASTTNIFDMSEEVMARLVQHCQHWRSRSGIKPYKIEQLQEGAVKTLQLLYKGTSTNASILARFCREF